MRQFLAFALTLFLIPLTAFAQSEIRDTLEFDRAGASGVEDLLTGRASSLYVGKAESGLNALRSVLLRGGNTLHGSGAPLIVVDGAILSSVAGEQIEMFWQDAYKGKTAYTNLSEWDALNLYDIEHIEILKNTAATAIYGELGANGAILIQTKRAKQDFGIEVRSNFGADFPGLVSHNQVALSSRKQRTDYRLSAFFRSAAVSSVPERNLNGGASFSLNTLAGSRVELGLSARVGLGEQLSGNPAEASADFEDRSKNIRTIESAWFNMKILNGFYWRTRIGVDYQTRSRTLWYGPTTNFGGPLGNAAGISLASKLLMTANTSLEYSRYIASHHSIQVSVGGEVYFNEGKFNTLNGTNILVTQLKAQGFGYRESADESALFRNALFRGGIFAKASYAYRKMVGVDLVARVDRAAKYDDKWNVYPSATAWLDIKELALGQSKTVSKLRLEGGFGIAGLHRYVPYYMFPQYTEEAVPAIPKDRWAFLDGWQQVRSREYNVRVEAGFLDDRFKLSLGYYNRTTDDNLFLYDCGVLDTASNLWKYGARMIDVQYAGRLGNQGVELEFDGRLLDLGNFKWDLGFNGAWNKLSAQLPCPEWYGGLSTTFRFYGVTIDLLADGSCGRGYDALRLARATLGYDIPLQKVRWMRNLSVYLSGSDIVRKTLVLGIKADF